MNDATTGAIRMVHVSAPGATSRARWTRRWPLVRDAVFATSSYPSGTRTQFARSAAQTGIRIGRKWRMTPVGVILRAGLDGRSLSPVRRSAEGVASCRPTCESQAQSYAPQGAPLTLRLPPVAAGSPFAHRAPDVTAIRLKVCAAA